MPHYYFHLHECGTVFVDEQGHDYPTLEQAREVAIEAARDLMSHEIKQGALCLACSIVIEDERRDEVLRLPFRDAVALSGV